MSQPPDPERYLELFDYLDLDNMEDRRIGIHLLRNYFSTVLADIADKKLGAMTSINQESLEKQWRQVRRKFETVSGQMPEEIENLLNQIMEVRDPVTHNDDMIPGKASTTYKRYENWPQNGETKSKNLQRPTSMPGRT